MDKAERQARYNRRHNRSVVAQDLRTPKYRQRRVADATEYRRLRPNEIEDLVEEELDGYED